MSTATKPLGGKAYGSIGHLPNSRLGPGDHCVNEGMARICTTKARDKFDRIIVQEKLDGSCCAVARVGHEIHALVRAGWPAWSSRYPQHQYFAKWVDDRREVFMGLLDDGQRIVGEWLAQAHGTRYELKHEPFVPFDIMRGTTRLSFDAFCEQIWARCDELPGVVLPNVLSDGPPMTVEDALSKLDPIHHGAIDPIEGAVWRVERNGKVDFLAKYVRPDKVDGCYLPEVGKCEPIWHWKPEGNR